MSFVQIKQASNQVSTLVIQIIIRKSDIFIGITPAYKELPKPLGATPSLFLFVSVDRYDKDNKF